MTKFSSAYLDGYKKGWYDSAPDDGSRTLLAIELFARYSTRRNRRDFERGYQTGSRRRRGLARHASA